MKNRLGITGIVSCIFLLLVSCGAENKPAQPAAPPPVAIAVYQVNEGEATYYDMYPGTVTALNEVEIRPQVSGYITGIFFTDGQRVTKGQKLYTIDEQQYRATYNQSVANLNVAKANQARAQQDADRYNELTIGISQVKMGAAVAPGQSILNTVSSDNPIAVDFAVDEKQISRFSLLKQKGGKTSDSTFRILLPDQSIYPVAGTLAFLDRAVDPQTGTIRARVVFKNTNGLLKPGLSCTIRVENNGNEKKILIPYKAIVEQMGEYFVYVVKDSIVTQSKVQLGTRINENIIVNEGLQTGMYIASEGVQKLRDGARVKVSQDSIPATTGKKIQEKNT
jgi:membrane fusion protein (multidrug efflux system)